MASASSQPEPGDKPVDSSGDSEFGEPPPAVEDYLEFEKWIEKIWIDPLEPGDVESGPSTLVPIPGEDRPVMFQPVADDEPVSDPDSYLKRCPKIPLETLPLIALTLFPIPTSPEPSQMESGEKLSNSQALQAAVGVYVGWIALCQLAWRMAWVDSSTTLFREFLRAVRRKRSEVRLHSATVSHLLTSVRSPAAPEVVDQPHQKLWVLAEHSELVAEAAAELRFRAPREQADAPPSEWVGEDLQLREVADRFREARLFRYVQKEPSGKREDKLDNALRAAKKQKDHALRVLADGQRANRKYPADCVDWVIERMKRARDSQKGIRGA